MVLVSYLYKFIYIKNSKVAGTSVEAFFEKYCIKPNSEHKILHERNEERSPYGIIGCRTIAPRHITDTNSHRKGTGTGKIFYGHMEANKIRDIIGIKTFNNYFKFCVVRNPYDKMISLYHFTNATNFKEFCLNNDCNNMKIHCIDGKPICDFFIRYENLENDIITVCNILGLKDFNINDLPKFKSEYRTSKLHYRDYYDEEIKMIVYKKHKDEIDFFNYTF